MVILYRKNGGKKWRMARVIYAWPREGWWPNSSKYMAIWTGHHSGHESRTQYGPTDNSLMNDISISVSVKISSKRFERETRPKISRWKERARGKQDALSLYRSLWLDCMERASCFQYLSSNWRAITIIVKETTHTYIVLYIKTIVSAICPFKKYHSLIRQPSTARLESSAHQ